MFTLFVLTLLFTLLLFELLVLVFVLLLDEFEFALAFDPPPVDVGT